MRTSRLLLSLAVLLAPGALAAQSAGPLTLPEAPPKSAAVRPDPTAAAAPHIAETYGAAPLAVLRPAAAAAPERLAEVAAWNAAGRRPVRDGFSRPLPQARRVAFAADRLTGAAGELAGGFYAWPSFDRVAWGAEVRVEGAARLRLHLGRVRLPAGARLWVHGDGESAGPFGLELRGPAGDLWTPSVAGEAVRLDVEIPAGALGTGEPFGFDLDRVAEIVPVEEALLGECNVDAACVGRDTLDSLDTYRKAVARLHFMSGDNGYLCSGGLLNDSDPRTAVPYLLTAHHCLSTAEEAATLEAYWDYAARGCDGPSPGLGQVPRSQGADLLASSSATDFTLLRLRQIPRGRTFLGWNADGAAIAAGTRLHRLSHPGGRTQSYAATRVDLAAPTCAGPRPRFLYSVIETGGTFGGSSGAPVVTSNGQVVGQLLGGCGSPDDCDPAQFTVDGGFAATYDQVRDFLDPPRACKAAPGDLCLGRSRFRLQLTWQDAGSGAVGTGRAIPLRRNETAGLFSFGDPAAPELLVRVEPDGDGFRALYSALGPLAERRFTLSVADAATGEVRRFDETPRRCAQEGQTGDALVALVGQKARKPAAGTCVARADT
ncbi:MAG TPA: trypsin-like peptidase domain-containing protein, partial [Thermoanaerobaculia bacterium]|nr:trypsin-like peptidase domain-containing protein [Thermoanaerobaculia bacterium]